MNLYPLKYILTIALPSLPPTCASPMALWRSLLSAFLEPMPLTVLRGVDVKTAPRLHRLGLATVADVRHTPLETLRRQLGLRAEAPAY